MSNMIIISIDTSNAAFDDNNAGHEVARILTNMAAKFADRGVTAGENMILRDSNGNRVGTCNVVENV